MKLKEELVKTHPPVQDIEIFHIIERILKPVNSISQQTEQIQS